MGFRVLWFGLGSSGSRLLAEDFKVLRFRAQESGLSALKLSRRR